MAYQSTWSLSPQIVPSTWSSEFGTGAPAKRWLEGADVPLVTNWSVALYAESTVVAKICQGGGSVACKFGDPSSYANPYVGATISHGEVYSILWSLYMALAAERDATVE